MTEPLCIGISTCPNDTFAFHALLEGLVAVEGEDARIELGDVEELNGRLRSGELDVAKASFHAALDLAGEVLVLPVGAAIGFGVGPLLLGSRAPSARARPPRVLSPGAWTTAHLLWRLFHEGEGDVRHVLFSDILPALERGEAELGVCIHEARFTWASRDVDRVEDLGETWERATAAPLPLGGIVGRRELGRDRLARVADAIAASLDRALARPREALASMRRHAQELDEGALWSHVELYVTERTRDLGAEGRDALAALDGLARERGLLAADRPPLELL